MQARPTSQRAEHLHLVLGANGASSALPAASMTAILGLRCSSTLAAQAAGTPALDTARRRRINSQ
jgi:hypothetical protein